MSKKFINVKNIAIPLISLVILLSQVTPSFAISSQELTSLMQTSSTVTVELYSQSEAPSAIALNAMTQAATDEFIDVAKTSWYYKDVMEAKKVGLVQGIGHGKYGPQSTISYAEFLTIISRICDNGVEGRPDGIKWYDKYIDSARNIGALSKSEALDALAGIPRQDMIKFTCKSLGIEPYTGNEVIFNDVKPADAAYINSAYNEYLTSGVGGHATDHSLVFGWGKTSTRAELATMALRIQAYRKDPVTFKKEKAAERAAEESAYKQQQASYEMFRGYKLPKDCTLLDRRTSADISCWVWWEVDRSEFNTIQQILSSKLDPAVVKQAIEYGKTKVKQGQYLSKSFKTGKYEIHVASARTADVVSFDVLLSDDTP